MEIWLEYHWIWPKIMWISWRCSENIHSLTRGISWFNHGIKNGFCWGAAVVFEILRMSLSTPGGYYFSEPIIGVWKEQWFTINSIKWGDWFTKIVYPFRTPIKNCLSFAVSLNGAGILPTSCLASKALVTNTRTSWWTSRRQLFAKTSSPFCGIRPAVRHLKSAKLGRRKVLKHAKTINLSVVGMAKFSGFQRPWDP